MLYWCAPVAVMQPCLPMIQLSTCFVWCQSRFSRQPAITCPACQSGNDIPPKDCVCWGKIRCKGGRECWHRPPLPPPPQPLPYPQSGISGRMLLLSELLPFCYLLLCIALERMILVIDTVETSQLRKDGGKKMCSYSSLFVRVGCGYDVLG